MKKLNNDTDEIELEREKVKYKKANPHFLHIPTYKYVFFSCIFHLDLKSEAVKL